MPATYDYTARTYRISCNVCGTGVSTSSVRRDATTTTGTLVSDTFAWVSQRNSFYGRCRGCERAIQNERRENGQVRTRGSRTLNRIGRALGINRRFGVELELTFPSTVTRSALDSALANAGLRGWRCRTDCSIAPGPRMTGWEIVSPILAGENGIEQIRTASRVLRALGGKPNRTTGMHVHHEVRDLSIAQVKTVARMWHTNQSLVDGLVSESRRGTSNRYCYPLSTEDLNSIERTSDLRQLSGTVSRYRKLNLQSINRYGTIEIRQHQGTCDAEKIISWIRFGQAIIDTAIAGAPVQAHSRVRDMLSSLGDRMDETARTFLLGRAVEFGAVAV